MSGYRSWTPGEILTASNAQNYLQDQSVMVFSGSAARSSAVVSPDEGMLTYLLDLNRFEFYDGSSWVTLVNGVGAAGTAGQALVSNGTASPSFTDTNAKFIKTDLSNKSASYTAVADDTNTVLNVTSASTVTIPDVMPEIGDMIQIINNSTGIITLRAGSGVTSWAGVGTAGTTISFLMDSPYTAAAVVKTAANQYRVIGKVVV